MDSCLPGLDFGLVCVPYLRIHVGKFLQQGRLLLRDPEIGEGGDVLSWCQIGTARVSLRLSLGKLPRILRHLLENYAELATGLVAPLGGLLRDGVHLLGGGLRSDRVELSNEE